MNTLETMIAEVDTLRSMMQYLTWLGKLSNEDFAVWTSWPTADYFCRGVIEEELRKRYPARYGLLRLKIELVPSPCWYNNLRERMLRPEWDKLRRQIYARYQWRCGICNTSNVTLHCHEIWQYDDKQHIQKLTGFICLCPMCHYCKHMGKAGLLAAEGKLDINQVIEHFMRVNQCSREEYEEHSKQAWDTWKARSRHEWTTDLGIYAGLVNEQEAKSSDESDIEVTRLASSSFS
jgi:hypothetical protein